MTAPTDVSMTEDEAYAAERESRHYRKERRKARERAGEIKELNITAMMDMMTIILVFLLKSYTASSINVQMGEELTLPQSTTQLQPKENIMITLSVSELSVNDKKVLPVVNGVIAPEYRADEDANNPLLLPLLDQLEQEVEKAKYIAKYNPAAPFTGQVNIVADRRIPYRTILAVLYTAGQAELGQYKLMAMKNE
ncbi:MAG: biopolymer transporter ExbD [Myxococcota bacterium]